jgi:hypothetical protein
MRAGATAAVLACAVAALGVGAGPAGAATTTFAPVADSYVASDAPSANYGSSANLRADATPATRSYLRFSVAGLSGTVTKATLRIYDRTALAEGYAVYGVASNSWGESTITWSNAPAPAGSATASSGKVAASTTTSLDVSPLVKGNGTISFALATKSATAIAMASRESGGTRPQLVVETGGTTTPPPPSGSDPVIAAAGDIACAPGSAPTATTCRQLYTSNLLANGGFTRVLTLGDNQYETGDLSAYQQSYGPTWGRVKSITRPAVGNHEYGASTTAAGYFDYFDGAGAATGPAGDRGRGYYSYDVGAWHVVALNSNCAKVACAAGSGQEKWLRSDLAAHPKACTLAYFHHPLFSSGEHGANASAKPLWDALYAAHADVVLNGHDHDYERFAPQTPSGAASASGIREFVVGTGGRSQRAFAAVAPNSQLRNTGTFGVLQLTLRPSGYDWLFRAEAGKTFADSGSASCH